MSMKVLLILKENRFLKNQESDGLSTIRCMPWTWRGFPIQRTSWVIMMSFILILMGHAVWCCCMLQNAVARRSSCMAIRHVRTLRIHSSVLTFWLHFLENIWPTCTKKPITWLRHLSIPKKLIQSYGVTTPIIAVSNGIDLKKYGKDPRKEEVFRDYFGIKEGQPVVICAGLLFPTQGNWRISSRLPKRWPHVRFIWLGSISKWLIPKKIRDIVNGKHPDNVSFPGYFTGDVFQGAMSGANAFLFPILWRDRRNCSYLKPLLVTNM